MPSSLSMRFAQFSMRFAQPFNGVDATPSDNCSNSVRSPLHSYASIIHRQFRLLDRRRLRMHRVQKARHFSLEEIGLLGQVGGGMQHAVGRLLVLGGRTPDLLDLV